MATTGLVTHAAFERHDTGSGHPERPDRLRAVLARLEASGLKSELEQLEAQPIDREHVERVHEHDYLDRAQQAIESGSRSVGCPDTVVSSASWDAALYASGALLQASEKVLEGAWGNAFVAARPPGHHAEFGKAMGFCLLNHVAVCARALQARHGIERVAILDWDVHHGNGTQHLFESDPSVLYVSLHQYPHYPGTGGPRERGLGEGEGATLNLPMPAGTGDVAYLSAFDREVLPKLEDFDPGFLLISAGFDAHRADPLSGTLLSEAAYSEMTRLVCALAAQRWQGRLVSLLEGGYDLEALAASVEAHVSELRGAR